jgi:hypothetical protein
MLIWMMMWTARAGHLPDWIHQQDFFGQRGSIIIQYQEPRFQIHRSICPKSSWLPILFLKWKPSPTACYRRGRLPSWCLTEDTQLQSLPWWTGNQVFGPCLELACNDTCAQVQVHPQPDAPVLFSPIARLLFLLLLLLPAFPSAALVVTSVSIFVVVDIQLPDRRS